MQSPSPSSAGATAASHSAAGESANAAACAAASSSSSVAAGRCQSTVGAPSCCAPQAARAASSATAAASSSAAVSSSGVASAPTAVPAAIPFPFPYSPYPQQLALMTHIFQTIEQGKGHVCIVESPTGTGKSLSLISACLYWLLEHHPHEQAAAVAAAAAAAASSSSSSQPGAAPSWVAAQHLELQAKAAAKKAADQAVLQASITKQLQKRASEEARQRKLQQARDNTTAATYDPDADLLPDDVGSGGGGGRVLSFAQQLELDDLEEKQESADKLLRELVLDQNVPYARKASVILERQARAARIAAITGRSSGGAGASGADAQVDELGGMLSRMLAGDRPRRKPQIIYASRTHSQLIQFVSEIKKTKYGQKLQVRPNVIPAGAAAAQQPPVLKAFAHSNKPMSNSSIPATGTLITSAAAATATAAVAATAAAAPPSLIAKVISLGSRSNLCVHPLTQHLKQHPLQLNDVCTDMQKNKPPEPGSAQPKVVAIAIDKNKLPTRAMLTASACPYLDPTSLELFHSASLSSVYDLEQLPALGATLHFCAYYGSRTASPQADVVVVPYASLLSLATRQALSIELDDAIVVIDEAHNVHDTINQLYSCTLTYTQLHRTLQALKLYRTRFTKKLKAENLASLNELIAMCEGFMVAFIRGHATARAQRARELATGGGGGGGEAAGTTRVLDDFIGLSGIDLSSGMDEPPSAAATAATSTPNGASSGSAAMKSSGLPASMQRNLSAASPAGGSSASSPSSSSSFSRPSRLTYTLIKGSNSFAASLHISDINPHRVQGWVEKSRMVQKIKGFLDRYHGPASDGDGNGGAAGAGATAGVKIHQHHRKSTVAMGAVADADYESTSLSPLAPVLELIKALNNADRDGRVCIDIVLEGGGGGGADAPTPTIPHAKSCLRFLMLNPSVHMHPLLSQARTVILAGGTMQPFEAIRTQLFPQLNVAPPFESPRLALPSTQTSPSAAPSNAASSTALVAASPPDPTPTSSDRLHLFSCGHVVPADHIRALVIPRGAGASEDFRFVHGRRGDQGQMDALAQTVLGLAELTPLGMVVFFTSYQAEQDTLEYWATHQSRGNRIYQDVEKAAAAGAAAASDSAATSSSSSSSPGQQAPRLTWLERMRARKCIFREPRSSGGIDHVLVSYTRIIKQAQAQASATGPTSAPTKPTTTTTAAASSSQQNRSQSFVKPSASAAAGRSADPPVAAAAAASAGSFTDPSLRAGQTGAMLFAVVGGKLSEGINFSDGLARAVIMVGLPYPNKNEPTMREKIAYLDAHQIEQKKKERQRKEDAAAAAAAAANVAATKAKEAEAAATESIAVTATATAEIKESKDSSVAMDVDQPAASSTSITTTAAATATVALAAPAPAAATPATVPSRAASSATNITNGGGGGVRSSSTSNNNSTPSANGTAGSRYLHTLCMRAVNQSIGRAIRHRGDYACIVLLDARYASPEVSSSLPRWITSGPDFKPQGETWPQARAAVSKFFAAHRIKARKATEEATAAAAKSFALPSPSSFAASSSSSSPPVAAASASVPAASSLLPSDAARKRKLDDSAAPGAATEQRPAKLGNMHA